MKAMKGREKREVGARPARGGTAKKVTAKPSSAKRTTTKAAVMKGVADRRMAPLPPHPMTAEQDRFEDPDEPFDEGVL